MLTAFCSVKMDSFLKLFCSVILFSTFVLNVESKPPYPDGSSNIFNMTCKDAYANKPLFNEYYHSKKLEETLNEKNVWFVKCMFTYAAVEFQADFILASPLKAYLNIKYVSDNLSYSLTQMKTKISHSSAKIMKFISQLNDVDDFDADSVRDGFIKLLKDSAKLQSFVLSDFPQLEVITANITLAPTVKKVKNTVIMTCDIIDIYKQVQYTRIPEYMKLLTDGACMLDCNFTFGQAKFQSEMFLVERSTKNKMDLSIFLDTNKAFYSQRFKTHLSNDSIDLLTIFTRLYLLEDSDSLKKESMTKFLLRDAESLMLLDFPEFGLKMINITQVTPVHEKTKSTSKQTNNFYFSTVFAFIVLPLLIFLIYYGSRFFRAVL